MLNNKSRRKVLYLAVPLDGFIECINGETDWCIMDEDMNLGLIDVYRLSVHPVILGAGKPLFVDIKQREELKLVDTRRFSSGVVQLNYNSTRK